MSPAPLVVSGGEPAGIGPDIILAAFARRAAHDLPAFYCRADAGHLARRARLLGLSVDIAETTPEAAAAAFAAGRLPCVPLGLAATAEPGRPDATSAGAAIAAIEQGVADVLGGRAGAIVTAPIAKSVLTAAGFTHPGHTEFLGILAEAATGRRARPVMMLWCPELAVVPVTIHIPLKEVPARLTEALIVETGRIVARDLKDRFGIAKPRLALAGLNPHAGEDGTLGREEIEIIAPAIARLQAEGVDAVGPLPADTMFHKAARVRYDAALAMYHDQGLVPIKTIAFDDGVNVTLGLPFIRTSPDHGTAFDIAGTGRADPASFIAALKLGARLAAADKR